MIPEGEDSCGSSSTKDDIMLAGYKECATEALSWLLGLGYKQGHPLIRSLAAHLTKKQAYLEKLNLEKFLVEETMKNSEDIDGTGDDNSTSKIYISQIKNNKEIQKALIEAVFKGCDLQYFNNTS